MGPAECKILSFADHLLMKQERLRTQGVHTARRADIKGHQSRSEHSERPYSPCVEVEGLPLLIGIEELFKVPVRVEYPPPEEWVCLPSCQLL